MFPREICIIMFRCLFYSSLDCFKQSFDGYRQTEVELSVSRRIAVIMAACSRPSDGTETRQSNEHLPIVVSVLVDTTAHKEHTFTHTQMCTDYHLHC